VTSSRPYLIRGLYEWMIDNSMTPHLLVDVGDVDTDLPRSLIKDNKIIFNIAPSAVINLIVGNVSIEFSARFSGIEKHISLPVSSVLAIYSRENGSGMTFDKNKDGPDPGEKKSGGKASRSSLRIVK